MFSQQMRFASLGASYKGYPAKDCFLNSARAPQGRLTVAWRFIARWVCGANLRVSLGTTDFVYIRYVLPSLRDFVGFMESVHLAMNHQAAIKGPCGTPRK
jgi:hypothetical protein